MLGFSKLKIVFNIPQDLSLEFNYRKYRNVILPSYFRPVGMSSPEPSFRSLLFADGSLKQ